MNRNSFRYFILFAIFVFLVGSCTEKENPSDLEEKEEEIIIPEEVKQTFSFTGVVITVDKITVTNRSSNETVILQQDDELVLNNLQANKSTSASITLKTKAEKFTLKFNPGDIISYIFESGNYILHHNETPIKSKTIHVKFVECKDGDGNYYPTVKIGDQLWMGENLKTTKYNNGDPIPLVTDDYGWSTTLEPAYCWYDNNLAYKEEYGALYNQFAMVQDYLCPTGWHIPTQEEFDSLKSFLGQEEVGNKLKEEGDNHWYLLNENPDWPSEWNLPTNETSFTALPGGYRWGNGPFQHLTYEGRWWIYELYTSNSFILSYDREDWTEGFSNDVWWKRAGFSIRCIKD